MNEKETKKDKEKRLMKEHFDKTYKKITIPLIFEKEGYDIRLEPLPRFGEDLKFAVSVRCNQPITISAFLIKNVPDIKMGMEFEAESLLRDCIGIGMPKQVISRIIDKVIPPDEKCAENMIMNYQLKKELGLK